MRPARQKTTPSLLTNKVVPNMIRFIRFIRFTTTSSTLLIQTSTMSLILRMISMYDSTVFYRWVRQIGLSQGAGHSCRTSRDSQHFGIDQAPVGVPVATRVSRISFRWMPWFQAFWGVVPLAVPQKWAADHLTFEDPLIFGDPAGHSYYPNYPNPHFSLVAQPLSNLGMVANKIMFRTVQNWWNSAHCPSNLACHLIYKNNMS